MRVLFDTGILLDYLQNKKPYSDNVFKLIERTLREEIEGFITSKSIKDIYYVFHKETNSKELAIKSIKVLLSFLQVLDTLNQDVLNALEGKFSKDLEDEIMIQTACREKMDYIITRNRKDYAKSPVKAIDPKEIA